MEEDYKPNSNRFKEEQKNEENMKNEKRVEQIITSPVLVKKKSGIKKLKDSLISDDVSNIKNFIFGDVLIPTIKKAVYDIFTEGINIVLYGDSRSGRRPTADKVSYRNYYDTYNNYNRYSSRPEPRRTYATYDYNEIILSTRVEAEQVLDALQDALNQYGLISVADLYDLVGEPGDPTANAYGWTSLRNAKIVRARDGYLIDMPRAMPIN